MTHLNLIRFIFVAALVRLSLLGLSPIMDTTEARYAEIARIMAELNDWVTPWFSYNVPFWGKPPLAFWMTAISFEILGVNEFAARFPHWLAGMLVLWIVWGMKPSTRPIATTYAVALLMGSVLFFVASGAVTTDMALVVGTTLSMRGFWGALQGNGSRHKSEGWLLFVGIAISLLAKGPIGLVLTGLACGLWTLTSGNLRLVWTNVPWVRGTLITLALALPWYVMAEMRSPGFFNYFILGEHLARFITPGWSGDLYGKAHTYPHGSIWLFMLLDTLPWVILIPILAWQTRVSRSKSLPTSSLEENTLKISSFTLHAERSWRNYLLFWALMPALFFTLAGNILWTYALPGLPALALLAGSWLASRRDQNLVRLNLVIGLLITSIIAVGFNFSMPLTGRSNNLAAKSLIATYRSQASSDQPLIYLGHRPFSASFYSRGAARLEATSESLARRLNTTSAYVAIRTNQLVYTPAALLARLERQSVHGYFTLFVTKKHHP